jgi:3-hydroxyacyl-CoA dehydrogenase
VIDPLVEDLVLEEAHFARVERRALSDEELCERLVLAMIDEAAAILHEGIAASARDIDLVSVHALGFPRWRGGLMHHADALGTAQVVARLRALAREDPAARTISPVLMDCARGGRPLRDVFPAAGP